MKFYTILASLFFSLLSACNFNEEVAVKGVDIHTHDVDGDTFVDFEAIVSLGNLKLPNELLAVKDLRSAQPLALGELSTQSLDDGTNRIALSINYSEAMKLNDEMNTSYGKNLPNGREIPSQFGVQGSRVIGIPILQNSRIYIGGDSKDFLFAGVALNIPALDQILNNTPAPLNLFTKFGTENDVIGLGGLMSSPLAGQNGLAVFAKRIHNRLSQRTIASLSEPQETQKMDQLTLFRLNFLLGRHAIVRIQ